MMPILISLGIPELVGIIAWIATFVLIVVLMNFIAKRCTRKEAAFYDSSKENEEMKQVELADPMSEVVIIFEYIQFSDQFLMASMPNITINHKDSFKLVEKSISLRLPPKFDLHFGIPYLKGEAFKLNETYTFDVGYVYRMKFQPRTFVFSKPRVTIQKLGAMNK